MEGLSGEVVVADCAARFSRWVARRRCRRVVLAALATAIGVLVWVALASGTQPYETYESTVAASEPVAQYRFDDVAGSGSLADAVSSDTATNSGITLGGEGPFGGSRSGSFGGEAYASLASNPLGGVGAFTVEAWVDWEGGASYKQPVFDFGSGPSNYVYLTPASSLSSHKMLFEIHTSAGSNVQLTTAKLAAKAWEYVAVTETSSGTLTLYVDEQEAVRVEGVGLFPSSLGSAPYAYLGRSLVSGEPDFKGSMSNVAFYTKALSEAQVRAHYHAGEFPVNTSLPTITGTAKEGSVLKVKEGSWSGLTPFTFAYQWQRCNAKSECPNIEGMKAKEKEYTATYEDVGSTLRVHVGAEDVAGPGEATSAQTATVAAVAPKNTLAPTIEGEARVGKTLKAHPGTWSGTPPKEFKYLWEVYTGKKWIEAEGGEAKTPEYRVRSSQVGDTLRVVVTDENPAGSKSADSEATVAVTTGPPVSVELPAISGKVESGHTLSASTGSWAGTEPFSYAFQWELCNAEGEHCEEIAGATGSTYGLDHSAVGHTLRVAVTAKNSVGSVSATSPASAMVVGPPVNISAPVISGAAKDGQTLSANTGSWEGTPPITYAYQWELCNGSGGDCSDIAGATSSSYVLGHGDVGMTVRVVVSASNSVGVVESVSGATPVVAALALSNTVAPAISGIAGEGQTLTAGTGSWEGTPAISYAYQWQSCDSLGESCMDVAGATGSTYVIGPSDVGDTLRVVVTAKNSAGSTSATSPDTEVVQGDAPSNTEPPVISGTAREGETLTANTGTWTGAAPLTYAYQWQRCSTGALGTAGTGNGQFEHPGDVALDPSGDLWVVDQDNDRVEEFNPSGGYLRQFGSEGSGDGQFSTPVALAIDPEGNVWVLDHGNQRIEELSDTGEFMRTVGSGQTANANGIAVTPDGDVWVSETQAGALAVFSSDGEFLKTVGARGSEPGQLRAPEGMAVDSEGDVWVVDRSNDRVEEFSEQGEYLQQFGSAGEGDAQLTHPYTIAVSSSGNVWVGDIENNRAEEFGEHGEYLGQFVWEAEDFLDEPVGLAVTASGDLWLTEPHSDRLEEFTEEGEPVGRQCEAIPGATSESYSLTAADVGSELQVIVTATDTAGEVGATSSATGRVALAAPESLTLPVVSGSAEEGQTLTASSGAWSGAEPISYAYQWQRCSVGVGSAGSGDGQFYHPADVAIGRFGQVWVLDRENDRVEEFTAEGEYLGQFGSEGSGPGRLDEPAALAVDANGDVWVADTGNRRVEEFSEQGEYMRTAGAGEVGYAEGIAIDGKNVWVSETYNGQIAVFNLQGELLKTVGAHGSEPGQVGEPEGLAVDYRDDVWVADWANNRIEMFDGEGNYIQEFESVTHPYGIAASNNGDVWVGWATGEGYGRVTEYTEEGEYVQEPSLGGYALSLPLGLAASGEDVWLTNAGNDSLEEFNLRGEAQRHCKTNISGATGPTYSLTAADVESELRVVVTATNADGQASATSVRTPVVTPVAPANTEPPVITGEAKDGSILTASNGVWSGSHLTYSYQWQSCNEEATCENIVGAEGSSYQIAHEDVGQRLQVVVTAENSSGTASATSQRTAVVQAAPPSNWERPGIAGVAQEGETLTVDTGVWGGTPPLTYTYQWQSCDALGETCVPIAGATTSSYVVEPSDVGTVLEVIVTAENAEGSASATSEERLVHATPPRNTELPKIEGEVEQGQTLTASAGTWTGTAPITYAYQWQVCGESHGEGGGITCKDIEGAQAASYVIAEEDVGGTLRVLVTATDAGGSESATSARTIVVAPAPPVNTQLPQITGAAKDGETLTATVGGWSGTAPSYAFQWQRCTEAGACEDIEGAESAEYVLASADVDMSLQVVVSASNAAGTAHATSARTALVSPSAPANTTLPTITGTARVGKKLSVSTGTWSGTLPLTYAYQWQSCNSFGEGCISIAGATSSTYRLTSSDLGGTLDVLVTATNAQGEASVSSNAFAVVEEAPEERSPPSSAIRYSYDADGQLKAVIQPEGETAIYSWDPAGNLLSIARRASTTLSVIGLTPAQASVGETVMITGTGFSSTTSADTVMFNGAAAAVTSATPTELVVTVPTGANSGDVSVQTEAQGPVSSTQSFSVAVSAAPSIGSLYPRVAAAGSEVTLTGANFEPGTELLSSNRSRPELTSESTTSISFRVPEATGSGPVVVATPEGSATGPDLYIPPNGIAASKVAFAEPFTTNGSLSVTVPEPEKVALGVFEGAAGENASLEVSESTIERGWVSIWSPEGVDLSGRESFSKASGRFVEPLQLPSTGTYTVLLEAEGSYTGHATLSLYRDTPVTATITPSEAGVSQTVATTLAGQKGEVSFSGTAGERIFLASPEVSYSGNVEVALETPEGQTLESKFMKANSYIPTQILPSTGTYTIYVNPSGTATGTIKLTAYRVPEPVKDAITPSESGASQTIETPVPGESGEITFSGSEGERIFVESPEVKYSGSVEVRLETPKGENLAAPFMSSGSFISTKTLPSTGTYRLLVKPIGVSVGKIKLTAYEVPANAMGEIAIEGSPLTISTTVPGQSAVVTFSGSASEGIKLTASEVKMGTSSCCDAEVSIQKPTGGSLVAPKFVGTSGRTIESTLTVAGIYTIYIEPQGNATGSMKLTLVDPPSGDALRAHVAGEVAVTDGQLATGKHAGGASGAPELLGVSGAASSEGSIPVSSSVERSTGAQASSTVAGFAIASQLRAFRPAQPSAWSPPGSDHLGRGWETGPARTPWTSVPQLHGADHVTALAGQVLAQNGLPIAHVRVALQGTHVRARTDTAGRFLLSGAPSGHQVLVIEGEGVTRGARYGTYAAGVELAAGRTTLLGYTVWLTPLDPAGDRHIASPTTRETRLTTPEIPGFEVRLPAGSVITDAAGHTVHNLNITAIPVDRTPFPLPPFVEVPLYFTVQPGRAYLSKGAQIVYPNWSHLAPGARVDFWNYDASDHGWYVYGKGTVTPDGSQVVPDPNVRVWELTGAMITSTPSPPEPPGGSEAPGACEEGQECSGSCPECLGHPCSAPTECAPELPTNPLSEEGAAGGDPADLATGLFVYRHVDLVLPDAIPIVIERTYRQKDTNSYSFGIGTSSRYDMRLWSENNYQEADLILPDGGRVHYVRTSPGESFIGAEYRSTNTPGKYYASTLKWNKTIWDLTLTNGLTYEFGDLAPLQGISDRFGNKLTITREDGESGNITQITTEHGLWAKFTYEGSRITSIADNSGRHIKYTYNEAGLLESATDAAGRQTTYGYDSEDELTKITDGRGKTYLENEYEAHGRISHQTLGDGGTFTFAYTENPETKAVEATTVTDPRGYERKVTFNAEHFPTSEVDARGTDVQETTKYEVQSGSGLVLGVTDPLGRITAYEYNSSGSVIKETSLAGTLLARSTEFTYEPNTDELASVTDALKHTTTYHYGKDGELLSETDPLGHTTHFEYNGEGERTAITNALGQMTKLTYRLGTVTSITDPLGRTTKRFLDSVGRVRSITTPEHQRTRYKYNPDNQVTTTTNPLGAVTHHEYDADGNLISSEDPNGHTTTYAYDPLDRPEGMTDPLGHSSKVVYNKDGDIEEAIDRDGKTSTFTYDPLNRLKEARYGVTGGSAERTIDYSYDQGNRPTKIIDSATGTYTPEYDEFNNLQSMTTPNGKLSYNYNEDNLRTSMTVPGQEPITYEYDNANRLKELTRDGQSVLFAYNNANQPTATTLVDGIEEQHGYDAAGELTSINYQKGTEKLGELDYSYDNDGRKEAVWGSYARTELPEAIGSATYNADNEQTELDGKKQTYDANGNLTSDGISEYKWDAQGQLAEISGGAAAVFAYDPFGRRIARTTDGTTTKALYDGSNTVQETTGSSTANLLTGPFPDEAFARTTSSGTESLLTDALGSTVALAGAGGKTETTYTYDPFGATTQEGASSENPYQYAGRENDRDGLYYNRARYYQPTAARFISQDPLGETGSGTNLYRYVNNTPTNATDPYGAYSSPETVAKRFEALPHPGVCTGDWYGGALAGEQRCKRFDTSDPNKLNEKTRREVRKRGESSLPEGLADSFAGCIVGATILSEGGPLGMATGCLWGSVVGALGGDLSGVESTLPFLP
jgi:RHS repeat-associated protein